MVVSVKNRVTVRSKRLFIRFFVEEAYSVVLVGSVSVVVRKFIILVFFVDNFGGEVYFVRRRGLEMVRKL